MSRHYLAGAVVRCCAGSAFACRARPVGLASPVGCGPRLPRPIALDLVFFLVGRVAAERCRQHSFWLCLTCLVLGMGHAPAYGCWRRTLRPERPLVLTYFPALFFLDIPGCHPLECERERDTPTGINKFNIFFYCYSYNRSLWLGC